MAGSTATARIDSPIGVVAIIADEDALRGVRILAKQRGELPPTRHLLLTEAVLQMRAFFNGALRRFDLPLAPLESEEGAALRAAIAAIPYGETLTYGALATQIGSVARAVGQACKANPYPIIIPCHRVVSTSGPEYYSGGEGPRTKSWLLDFEYANLPPEKRTRLL